MKAYPTTQAQAPCTDQGIQKPVDDGRCHSDPDDSIDSKPGWGESSELVSDIAHDLNNLLTPILLYAEVLQKAILKGGEIKPALATQLIEAVEQAQAFAEHLTHTQFAVSQNLVGIHHVIKSAISSIEPRKEDRNLEISLDRDLWHVTGDETLLFRIFLNLLINALQATKINGCIWIQARNRILQAGPSAKRHAVVQIDISDNGTGMSDELQKRVFSRHITTGDSKEHSGIGLAVVKKIVNHLGGSVNVESQQGNGSTFSVLLPASPAEKSNT